MANMTLDQALDRIAAAGEYQEIAVFRCDKPEHLNCVFARTVETVRRIGRHDPDFIGVFDRNDDPAAVRETLRPHLRAADPAGAS